MRLKVAFVGFRASRVKRVVQAIEGASRHSPSPLSLEAAEVAEAKADPAGLADKFGAVFVSADLGPKRLAALVDTLRRANVHIPVVITYGAEPAGTAFQLAARQDCWLFSEVDRLKRGLTAEELGLELQARGEASEIGSRLMEILLVAGPCSTGD